MRLLPFPDVRLTSQTPLSGPETIGANQGTSIGNFTQTISSLAGGWVWQFNFHPMSGDAYVDFRGWLFAMHKGANATRWEMTERDKLKPAAAGINYQPGGGMTWANGMGWAGGQLWKTTYPNVALTADASKDATVIELDGAFWGHKLKWGRRIGFFPFYFGMHQITEVISPGRYRIWPPLRKDLKVGDFATLHPVMALRLLPQDFEYPSEDAALTMGVSVRMFEFFDYDVRKYVTD